MAYYETLKEKGENVYIDKISYEDFMKLGKDDVKKRFMDIEEQEQKEQFYEQEVPELSYASTEEDANASSNVLDTLIPEGDSANGEQTGTEKETVFSRMKKMHFTKEQVAEVQRALHAKVPMDVILDYFYPETPVTKMMTIRRSYEMGKGAE